MPGTTSRDSTRFVALFQKAHNSIANVQRLDEQIAALFEQRRKALEDLRAVQSQINNEFDRMLELDRVVPADMLAADGRNNGKAKDSNAPEIKSARTEGSIPLEGEEAPPPRFGGRQGIRPPMFEPVK